MPKINIREYDKTTPGSISSANFSVVVPGFVSKSGITEDGTSVFDENGIYECSSQKDFVSYVGKVAPQAGTLLGEGPTFTKLKNDAGELVYKKVFTAKEYYTEFSKCLYYKETPAETKTEAGFLVDKDPANTSDNTFYDYKFADETYYKGHQEFEYYVIMPGYEGRDKIENVYQHMGNQIAYNLLGLGYTILYCKITKLSELKNGNFWEALKDRVNYNFRYIISGLKDDVQVSKSIELANQNKKNLKETEPEAILDNVYSKMVNLATRSNEDNAPYDTNGRGDCIALCDIPKSAYIVNNKAKTGSELISSIQAKVGQASTYAAYFAPVVSYEALKDSDYSDNIEFPASFHYLACAINAFQNYNEWYAVSGYTRGTSPINVSSLAVKIGDIAINKLQPRDTNEKAVNVITKINNSYYLWGNRTTSPSKSQELVAQNFLNIRQLCCSLKKEIFSICRRLTFDPNSDTLWTNFVMSLTPMLETMKSDQGIKDYKIVKAKTDKKATLAAIVRIVPIEAVEDFDIKIYLEDSVSGTVATFDEN